MKTYIALLRGINVGGRNVLRMAELAALCERAGCSNVRTYVQSGNVVYRSAAADAGAMATKIAAAVHGARGFEPRVLVRTAADFKKTAAGNPFREADANPQSVHVYFLSEQPKDANVKAMELVKTKSERFALKAKAFYVHAPEGLGKSRLAACAERHLGVDATARNWRTVQALIEIAESLG